MDINKILVLVIAVGLCIFLGGFVLKKSDFLWRMLFRGLAGSGFIWGVCMVAEYFQMHSPVGLNVWTASVSAVLGLPGIVMLYVMGIYARIG